MIAWMISAVHVYKNVKKNKKKIHELRTSSYTCGWIILIFLYEGSRTNEIICTRALYDGKYVRTFYLRAYFSYILKTQIIIQIIS